MRLVKLMKSYVNLILKIFITFLNIFILGCGIEEPVVKKQVLETLHSSVKDFKEKININDVEMQKQLAAVEEYKSSVNDLASWFGTAESDENSRVSKPCTKKDIENQLTDIKVRIKLI